LLYKYSTLLSRFRLLFFLGGESGQQIGLALLMFRFARGIAGAFQLCAGMCSGVDFL